MIVKESPFANTYGALVLIEQAGKHYLQMQDCCGDEDFFGPLTARDIEAFNVLCDVPIKKMENSR